MTKVCQGLTHTKSSEGIGEAKVCRAPSCAGVSFTVAMPSPCQSRTGVSLTVAMALSCPIAVRAYR